MGVEVTILFSRHYFRYCIFFAFIAASALFAKCEIPQLGVSLKTESRKLSKLGVSLSTDGRNPANIDLALRPGQSESVHAGLPLGPGEGPVFRNWILNGSIEYYWAYMDGPLEDCVRSVMEFKMPDSLNRMPWSSYKKNNLNIEGVLACEIRSTSNEFDNRITLFPLPKCVLVVNACLHGNTPREESAYTALLIILAKLAGSDQPPKVITRAGTEPRAISTMPEGFKDAATQLVGLLSMAEIDQIKACGYSKDGIFTARNILGQNSRIVELYTIWGFLRPSPFYLYSLKRSNSQYEEIKTVWAFALWKYLHGQAINDDQLWKEFLEAPRGLNRSR